MDVRKVLLSIAVAMMMCSGIVLGAVVYDALTVPATGGFTAVVTTEHSPQWGISVNPIVFAHVPVGSIAPMVNVTITNLGTGSAPLTITSSQLPLGVSLTVFLSNGVTHYTQGQVIPASGTVDLKLQLSSSPASPVGDFSFNVVFT